MDKPPASPSMFNHALAIGLTVIRLPLAERMARKTERKESIGLELGLFILADIADGVLARKLKVDTPKRRFADAVVDRVSVLRVGWAMSKANPVSKPFLQGLAGRELIVAGANAVHYLRSGEVVQGHGIHKLGTLSTALFGLAASTGNVLATKTTGLAANIINYGLAIDYIYNAIEPHGTVNEGVRHIAFENTRGDDSQANTR
jgi:phosphatidylglycerophosphate synthase